MNENTKKLVPTDNPGVFNASEDCEPITDFRKFYEKLRTILNTIKEECNNECPAPWNADTISSAIRVLLTRIPDIGLTVFHIPDINLTIDDVRCAAFFFTDLDAKTEEESNVKEICAVISVKHPYAATESQRFIPIIIGINDCDNTKYHTVPSIITGLLDAAVLHQWDNSIIIDILTTIFAYYPIPTLRPIDVIYKFPNGNPDCLEISKHIYICSEFSDNGKVKHIGAKYFYPKCTTHEDAAGEKYYIESQYNSSFYLNGLCASIENATRAAILKVIDEGFSVSTIMDNLNIFTDPLADMLKTNKSSIASFVCDTYDGEFSICPDENTIIIELDNIFTGILKICIKFIPESHDNDITLKTSYEFIYDDAVSYLGFKNVVLRKEYPVLENDSTDNAVDIEETSTVEEPNTDGECSHCCNNENNFVGIGSIHGIYGRFRQGVPPEFCGNTMTRFPIEFRDNASELKYEMCIMPEQNIRLKDRLLVTFALLNASHWEYTNIFDDFDILSKEFIGILEGYIKDYICRENYNYKLASGDVSVNIIAVPHAVHNNNIHFMIEITNASLFEDIVFDWVYDAMKKFVLCIELSDCNVRHYYLRTNQINVISSPLKYLEDSNSLGCRFLYTESMIMTFGYQS